MALNTAGQTKVSAISHDNPMLATGTITFDATAIVATDQTRIEVGFRPRMISIKNLQDGVTVEWMQGMPANTWELTVATGVQTLDTTAGLLVIDDKGVSILQAVAPGVIKASKTLRYRIWG